ncbi:hypothetical protein KORDIASMS9_02090 [Kordia sp. SMS9]|uniref:hypothetical protein n=1 Tax=Kordia sp. SMS9 TaxID=2282170 RepID=UPI000E0DCCAF|nr:hypothetical protein [Kordia sp. SMS9]AXG69862.1 hypothetical protein KORDIASMS9_02090 [Kordia sp. SMS9]
MKKHIYTILISFFLIGTCVLLILKHYNSKDTLSEQLSKIDTEMRSTWIDKQLIYPSELIPINTNEEFKTLMNTKETLTVNYLDSDCSVCVEDLKSWDTYLTDTKKKAVFIISGSEQLKVDYMINDVLFFKHPVFYDEYDAFNQTNELPYYKAYHSFQLKDKKIVDIGSPILLENLK